MDIYESEKEQIEAIKKWWKENGRAVVVGLALGLGAVFGWTYWQSYQANQAEQVSLLYTRLINLASGDQLTEVRQEAENLIREYPTSGYAPLAALILARAAFQQQEADEAKRHLRWTMEQASRKELQMVARLRLARVLLGEGDYEGALGLLDGVDPGSFRAGYEELRGDVLLAQGHRDRARSAYKAALANIGPVGENRQRIQMKLDDLGRLEYPQQEIAAQGTP